MGTERVRTRMPDRNRRAVQRTQNTMLRGSGSNVVPQDRGAGQTAAVFSSNPLNYANWFERWREFVRWYRTSWEVRKIVDIPVDDAFRKPFRLTGIGDEESKVMMAEWDRLNCERQFRRAYKQERLLGGCCLLLGLADCMPAQRASEARGHDSPVDIGVVGKAPDCFKFVNVVDVNRVSRGSINTDVFSGTYDQVKSYLIDGVEVDTSRLVVFDSDPLFNRQNIRILENWTINPAGFGDSVIGPIYDLLVRETGTQEGAYHLVNLASVLLASVKDYKNLASTKPGQAALNQIAEVMQAISLYRGALLDGNAEIKQHTASFGSVPELVMTFLQILCGACDIPETRFLGTQAKGLGSGHNEGDLENYYSMVGVKQRQVLMPKMVKVFGYIGASKFGLERWLTMKPSFGIEFPALWSSSEKEQAELANTWIGAFAQLYQLGLVDAPTIQTELRARNIFVSEVELVEQLNQQGGPGGLGPDGMPVDAAGALGDLADAEEEPDGGGDGGAPGGKTTVETGNADWRESEHPRDITHPVPKE